MWLAVSLVNKKERMIVNFLLTLSTLVAAKMSTRYDNNRMVLCDGIYAQQDIPFAVHSAKVQVKVKPHSRQGALTLAVYSFEDRLKFNSFQEFEICYIEQVKSGKCNETQLNQFIIPPANASEISFPFLNQGVHWHSDSLLAKRQSTNSSGNETVPSIPDTIHNTDSTDLVFLYNVTKTGYFCVIAVPDETEKELDYSIRMFVQGPYGALPALFFPALPFFASQFAVYSLIGFVWLVASLINRKELLPIQNLIGGMIFFLVIENAVNMAFFIDFNNHGYISMHFQVDDSNYFFLARSFLAGMVSINALRNSLSFFMLLVVCEGYGVVFPSLGNKMKWCIGLTIVHFVFGALYFTTSLVVKDANSFLVLLLGLPLAITLSIFYFWILLALSNTIHYLESKRQSVKLLMYRRLYKILTVSIVILFVIFVLNGLNLFLRFEDGWIANQWRWHWLLLDGALNINYFIAFVAIAYLWLPTMNNQRLALEELGSEDVDDIEGHGFEQDLELDGFSKFLGGEEVEWDVSTILEAPEASQMEVSKDDPLFIASDVESLQ